ncbi:hypothetical protein MTIM_53120 [Mycobacterium timonense]|uniref:TetR family transcriptional regulator n=1 Tax=Mycobacterium timonense TaxID=701043 RepID=A0A7I9ZEU9_9MYCO|nr:hypothetical protein MTIM_53120 [Mycobacterium timonense]
MRGVCARTGLNDRYFYEDFKTREDLLVAAWDGVRDMLGEVSALFDERVDRPPIETITAAIAIVVDRIARDPGRAHILLAQHVGSSPLQDRRAVALQEATQLVVEQAGHISERRRRDGPSYGHFGCGGVRRSHHGLALRFARGDRKEVVAHEPTG